MSKRYITRDKNCHCHTCGKDFHYLGINSHRARHRRIKEDCTITYTHGNTLSFKYSEKKEKKIRKPILVAMSENLTNGYNETLYKDQKVYVCQRIKIRSKEDIKQGVPKEYEYHYQNIDNTILIRSTYKKFRPLVSKSK